MQDSLLRGVALRMLVIFLACLASNDPEENRGCTDGGGGLDSVFVQQYSQLEERTGDSVRGMSSMHFTGKKKAKQITNFLISDVLTS